MSIRFVDLNGIVDYHSFKLFFHNLKLIVFFSLLTLSIHDEGYFINMSCALNLIFMFLSKKKNLTCNHPPVNFVNAIYQCYLNQIICLCTINIGSALFNSVFSNTIIFYSNVCYIYNERPSSSQYIYFYMSCISFNFVQVITCTRKLYML